MKHNQNHNDAQKPVTPLVPVRFEFIHPTAGQVAIAGSFNHWQPEDKPLRNSGAGRWWNEIELAPGTYEYCLVVDGEWIPDPHAEETVPNPFGGKNSILKVASSPEAAHRSDTTNLPLKNTNKRKTPTI